MSPRATFPATPPPLPKPAIGHALEVVSNTPRDPDPPGLAPPIAGCALGAHLAPAPIDSAGCAAPRDQSPATTFYRAQSGWFPYVESTPQYNPHMVFTKRLREGVRTGKITCSVRIWKFPHVKA